MSNAAERLLRSPYGHYIRRDEQGNSHVSLFTLHGGLLHTIVAPSFDEAVTLALDLAEKVEVPTQTDLLTEGA